jgi:hypothetical protein
MNLTETPFPILTPLYCDRVTGKHMSLRLMNRMSGNHQLIIPVLYLNKNSVMKLVRLSLFDDFDWLSISLCVGLMAGHTL